MKPGKIIIITLLLTIFNIGCNNRRKVSDRTLVTVSIAPVQWFVNAIGGDSVDVNVLLPAGSNPESFEPGMSAIKRASESSVIFITGGLPFERNISDRLGAGRIIDTSAGITKLYGTHNACGHDHAHHQHGVWDPHTWSSVKNGKQIAENVYNALVEIDPARKDYYTDRYGRLTSRLDSLDVALGTRLAEAAGASILVMHPSLGYFARDYGLKQVSIGSESKEMSVQGLRRNLDQAKLAGESVLLVQAEFDGRQAEAIARQIGARVEMINLLNPDWEEEIIRIADVIAGN